MRNLAHFEELRGACSQTSILLLDLKMQVSALLSQALNLLAMLLCSPSTHLVERVLLVLCRKIDSRIIHNYDA